MRDCDQYYSIATTTLLFYDFLLTLGDEVSRVTDVSLATFIVHPVKDQIRLAREEIIGCVGRITRYTAFIDDVIVFVVFIAVRSPLQQPSSFLKG